MDIKDILQFPALAGLDPGAAAPKVAAKGDGSFGELLNDSLAEVNRLQHQASQSVEALARGDKVNLHETLIAMEQADVSFRLMMQVRNKIIEAYQEIVRIQV